jgi:hypothetical protein
VVLANAERRQRHGEIAWSRSIRHVCLNNEQHATLVSGTSQGCWACCSWQRPASGCIRHCNQCWMPQASNVVHQKTPRECRVCAVEQTAAKAGTHGVVSGNASVSLAVSQKSAARTDSSRHRRRECAHLGGDVDPGDGLAGALDLQQAG